MVSGSFGGRGRRRYRVLLATALGAVTLAGGLAVPGTASAASGLGDAAASRGRYFGAAVQVGKLTDPVYTGLIEREFNSVTPENVLEWDAVEPRRDQFTFLRSDQVVDYALAQGAAVRARGPVTPSASQVSWLAQIGAADDLRTALRNHITVTMNHFRGRIRTWDVVNEAFYENGTYRQSFFLNRLGPGYLEDAFRTARAADPDARLCYNDYNIEDFAYAKTQAVYNLVRDFKARGVPIDCIGLESHFSSPTAVNAAYQQTIAAFAALGVDVEITELDIPNTSGSAQADAYRRAVSACVVVSRCRGITVWGVRDIDSWRSNLAPLLFDSAGARKPAYYGALSGLGSCGVRRHIQTVCAG